MTLQQQIADALRLLTTEPDLTWDEKADRIAQALTPDPRFTWPEFWEEIAGRVRSPYTYDLRDSSHLLDVVQIVCEAIAAYDRETNK